MASWKTVTYALFLLLGVIVIFLNETECHLKKSRLSFKPPRLRDYLKVHSEIVHKPGEKKKRLRTELTAAGNKFVVQLPNPPIVFDHVLEHWPYHRVYMTSILGIINYMHKMFRLGYKIVWIFIDMLILLVKIVFQVTEIGKLKHSYDELNRPHPFSFHDYDE